MTEKVENPGSVAENPGPSESQYIEWLAEEIYAEELEEIVREALKGGENGE